MPLVAPSPFNILIVGSGGREHALAWKLAQSASVARVYVAPGNGGTASMGGKVESVSIGELAFDELVTFALDKQVALVVPGPEVPLVAGIADRFAKVGIPTFGPSAAAAELEGSKAFAKTFMHRHGIPTAAYGTFTDAESAVRYIESAPFERVVVKASGLYAGKGVLVPETKAEAVQGVRDMMGANGMGDAAKEVVVEEYLEGDELSLLCLSDGHSIHVLPAAQDHKRALDGDKGPNTGGMGAYAPAPLGTPAILERATREVLQRAVDGMRKDGTPFVGTLFAGLMVSPAGEVKALEYNVRFGDPETQVLMQLVDGDLALAFLAAAKGCLDAAPLSAKKGAVAATVVVAAQGYPGSYAKGAAVTAADDAANGVTVFHAGTKRDADGKLVTSGGRVLAVTAVDASLQSAVRKCYAHIDAQRAGFAPMHLRRDIAHRALNAAAHVQGATYAAAGVSIDAGNDLVELIKPAVRATRRAGADAEIGGFGGLFDLSRAGYDANDTLLVAATDGVGTKLKVALAMGVHDTVGIDLVAMNVNDLVVQGAEPLMFLDYYATGRLEVPVAADVVKGVAAGCVEAGCALVGGETAEMPSMYAEGDYDVAGFTVGAVRRKDVLPRMDEMKAGDVLLALGSSGMHSNGFSLARHIVEKCAGLAYASPCPWDASAQSIGHALLVPTRIYVKPLLPAVRAGLIKGMAHITGGGLPENLPRVLPAHLKAHIQAGTWPVPAVFQWLRQAGNVAAKEMLRTFNCGVGMVLVVSPELVEQVKESVKSVTGEDVYTIGTMEARAEGEEHVHVEGF